MTSTIAEPRGRASSPSPPDSAAGVPPAQTGGAARSIIRFDRVSKRFAGSGGAAVAALDDVSLKVRAGEVLGIIGRSGAGKSTLIRCINGLERPQAGSILVDGIEVVGLNGAGLLPLRRRIGMIFQHFNLLSSRTVYGNVARSEEHTSELQSLMRISYAVFCL